MHTLYKIETIFVSPGFSPTPGRPAKRTKREENAGRWPFATALGLAPRQRRKKARGQIERLIIRDVVNHQLLNKHPSNEVYFVKFLQRLPPFVRRKSNDDDLAAYSDLINKRAIAYSLFQTRQWRDDERRQSVGS